MLDERRPYLAPLHQLMRFYQAPGNSLARDLISQEGTQAERPLQILHARAAKPVKGGTVQVHPSYWAVTVLPVSVSFELASI